MWPSRSPALAEPAAGSWGGRSRHEPLLTSKGTAPPARPRVSCRLRGWGGAVTSCPSSTGPPPPDELGPQHTAPGSSGSLHAEQRPSLLYTLSSKHSCTLGASAAGKWRWMGVGGLRARCTAPWGQGVVASQLLARPQQGARPPLAAGGERGDQRPPEHPHSGLHNTHLPLKGDLSPPLHLVNSPISLYILKST